MGRKNRLDSIEAKIEKAQQRVSITCDRYEAATAQLKELLDKRDELRKKKFSMRCRRVGEPTRTY